MLFPESTSAVSSPGLRASEPHGCRNPPQSDCATVGGSTVDGSRLYSLDSGPAEEEEGAAWTPEEEEEGDEVEGGPPAVGVRRTRLGCRERAARRRAEGDGAEEEGAGGGSELLDGRLATLYRAAAARANYLALDRPELSFAAKELCRRMSSPRQCDLQALRRVCRYLRGAPRVVYEFGWQPAGGALQVYADTDFAGCVATRRSTSLARPGPGPPAGTPSIRGQLRRNRHLPAERSWPGTPFGDRPALGAGEAA